MTNVISTLLLSAAETAGSAHGAEPMWKDTSLWVSAGFLIVVGFALYKGVHKSVGTALDKRAQDIADELDEARKMREEAQEILAQYQRRQREAEEEANAIVEQAKRDAKRLAASMREKLDEQIARRAKSAEEKIARAETQALAEVRNQTVDVAIEATRDIIRNRMDQSAHAALAEKAVDELKDRLH